jgi:hypothetical protein
MNITVECKIVNDVFLWRVLLQSALVFRPCGFLYWSSFRCDLVFAKNGRMKTVLCHNFIPQNPNSNQYKITLVGTSGARGSVVG